LVYLDVTDPKNPLASPLYADLTGLPPIRIHVGDNEVLLCRKRRRGRHRRQAGNFDGNAACARHECGRIDKTHIRGMIALGTNWTSAQFDNLSVR
jgi:acetyl esterase/lipase